MPMVYEIPSLFLEFEGPIQLFLSIPRGERLRLWETRPVRRLGRQRAVFIFGNLG